jgi:hypothetical protein
MTTRCSGAAELVGKPESEWPSSSYSGVHCIFPSTTFTYTDSIDGETPVSALFRLFPGREIGQTEVLFSTFEPLRSAARSLSSAGAKRERPEA